MFTEMMMSAGGGSGIYIQRGKPSSNIIQCGFRASKVYLSDPTYNTNHKLIQSFDYAISQTEYLQRYDNAAGIYSNVGDYPFVLSLGDTSVTISQGLIALLSDNAVIIVCE